VHAEAVLVAVVEVGAAVVLAVMVTVGEVTVETVVGANDVVVAVAVTAVAVVWNRGSAQTKSASPQGYVKPSTQLSSQQSPPSQLHAAVLKPPSASQ
jgi:hypothetical protein